MQMKGRLAAPTGSTNLLPLHCCRQSHRGRAPQPLILKLCVEKAGFPGHDLQQAVGQREEGEGGERRFHQIDPRLTKKMDHS
jgi:hypothetical protein